MASHARQTGPLSLEAAPQGERSQQQGTLVGTAVHQVHVQRPIRLAGQVVYMLGKKSFSPQQYSPDGK